MAISTYSKRPDMAANGTEEVYKRAFLRSLRNRKYLNQDKLTWVGPIFLRASGFPNPNDYRFTRSLRLDSIRYSSDSEFVFGEWPLLPIRKVATVEVISGEFPRINGYVQGINTPPNTSYGHLFHSQADAWIEQIQLEDMAHNLTPRSLFSPNQNLLNGGEFAYWRVDNANLILSVNQDLVSSSLIYKNEEEDDYFTARISFFSYGHYRETSGEAEVFVDWIERTYPDLVEVGTAIQIMRATGRATAAQDLGTLYATLFDQFQIDSTLNQIPV